MSVRLVASSASRRVLSPATRFNPSRTFSLTAARQAGKEDALRKFTPSLGGIAQYPFLHDDNLNRDNC